MTAVVLIDVGLVAFNSYFSREFNWRRMKQKLLASEWNLFNFKKTVALSFKMEKAKVSFRIQCGILWTVNARAVYRTADFWRDEGVIGRGWADDRWSLLTTLLSLKVKGKGISRSDL